MYIHIYIYIYIHIIISALLAAAVLVLREGLVRQEAHLTV